MIRRGLVSVALLSLCSCGTALSDYMAGPRVYGGVRLDFQAVWERPGFLVLLPFDLPLSLAMDTIISPYTIYHSAAYGEQELKLEDFLGEPSKPRAVVEGILTEGDFDSTEIVERKNWPPAGLHPIIGARIQVYANRDKKPESAVGGVSTSGEKGQYLLSFDGDPPWKIIRIEGDGFHPREIDVHHDLHDPTDLSYWSEHRLLIRMTRR